MKNLQAAIKNQTQVTVHTAKQLAKRYNVSYQTIKQELFKLGCAVVRSLKSAPAAAKPQSTKADQYNRIAAAYQIAVESGNTVLAATLKPMLDARVAQRNTTEGRDIGSEVTRTERPVVSMKKMAVKLKAEKYDPRISTPSSREVARRLKRARKYGTNTVTWTTTGYLASDKPAPRLRQA